MRVQWLSSQFQVPRNLIVYCITEEAHSMRRGSPNPRSRPDQSSFAGSLEDSVLPARGFLGISIIVSALYHTLIVIRAG